MELPSEGFADLRKVYFENSEELASLSLALIVCVFIPLQQLHRNSSIQPEIRVSRKIPYSRDDRGKKYS